MGKAAAPLALDADQITKLAEVLQSLKIRNVKVRTLTIDIEDEYGWGRTRVRVVGGRSRWDKSVAITKITRLP